MSAIFADIQLTVAWAFFYNWSRFSRIFMSLYLRWLVVKAAFNLSL